MKMIDELFPKVKAEVRLDKDSKTLWIKSEELPLKEFGRVIVEDGSTFCKVLYEVCE